MDILKKINYFQVWVFGFISLCRERQSSTGFLQVCGFDKHAHRCCNQMHARVHLQKGSADLPLPGHLIMHLAPRDFRSFHGSYLCSLVTTAQGPP